MCVALTTINSQNINFCDSLSSPVGDCGINSRPIRITRRKKKLQQSEFTITITFGCHFCGLVKTGPNEDTKESENLLWLWLRSAGLGFSPSPKFTRVSKRPVRIHDSDCVHRRGGTIVQSLAGERKPVKTKKYEEDSSYSLLHQPFGHSHLNVFHYHKN